MKFYYFFVAHNTNNFVSNICMLVCYIIGYVQINFHIFLILRKEYDFLKKLKGLRELRSQNNFLLA
jgi:hypothetical protein